MTDLSYLEARTAAPARHLSWPILVYVAVGTAGVAGFVTGRFVGGDVRGMEWQLVFLLRFMALVKGAMAFGALALTQWRLRRPISARLAVAYAMALAAMALAPGLIWSLAEIVPGAATFHVGLFLYLLLAWRDDAVILVKPRS